MVRDGSKEERKEREGKRVGKELAERRESCKVRE